MNSIENITIRTVRPEDLDAVTEVEAVCFPKAEAADRKSFEARIKAFPDSFFVAEDAGRIVGFINGAVVNERTGMRCMRTPPSMMQMGNIRAFLDWM